MLGQEYLEHQKVIKSYLYIYCFRKSLYKQEHAPIQQLRNYQLLIVIFDILLLYLTHRQQLLTILLMLLFQFPGEEISRKRTNFTDFRANRLKISRKCPLTVNFLTKKFGGKFLYFAQCETKRLKSFQEKVCDGIFIYLNQYTMNLGKYNLAYSSHHKG